MVTIVGWWILNLALWYSVGPSIGPMAGGTFYGSLDHQVVPTGIDLTIDICVFKHLFHKTHDMKTNSRHHQKNKIFLTFSKVFTKPLCYVSFASLSFLIPHSL